MQSLDVISVNIWQILISLANLAILYFIIRKFLYKPVKNMISTREKAIADEYAKADEAVKDAENAKKEWNDKMAAADGEAKEVVDRAVRSAKEKSENIVLQAKDEAVRIKKKAAEDAENEKRKARAEMKKEVADISVEMASKILAREMSDEDRTRITDSVIKELDGKEDDGNN